MINITVNGKEDKLPGPISIAEYLSQNGYPCGRIAVEKNGSIVPKAQYESAVLTAGDKLEIVTFVGGG